MVKKYLLIYDSSSNLLSKYFSDFKKVELYFPNKVSYSPKEIREVYEILSQYNFRNSIILMGSNRKHWLTYLLIKIVKPEAYLHIDQHPDDYELVNGLSGGNFTKYIFEELGIPMYYIGFMKPEHKNIFNSLFIIRKDHKNLNQLPNFFKKFPSNLYVSIDLDILKRKYICNILNNYSFLLDLEELIHILKNIRNPIAIDIIGFQIIKNCSIESSIKTIRKIIKELEKLLT